MKVLVTGSTGFIGGYIGRNISNDFTVITPNKEELNLVDINSVNYWFKHNKVDAVVHSAMIGRDDPFGINPAHLSDSLLMFRNLWIHRSKYLQFINLGSAYELDLNNDNSNIIEESIIDHLPTTSYGFSKNLIARIIKDTDNFFNLRLFGVFHETESSKRFFKKIIEQENVIIDNDRYFDYIYLEDILPMIVCILKGNAHHKDINMVYPYKYRLSELAYELCNILDIDYAKIKIATANGCNLTGNSLKFISYDFPLVGIQQGLRNYK